MSIISLKNVSHTYSEGTPLSVSAIRNINLDIESGELVGIIGHTGSGKSTLVQHLNGLLKPTEGTVEIDGENIWANKKKIRSVRFKVGLCFQYPEYQLFEETVYKDIAFGPKNMGLDEQEIDRRVREAAGFVGLTEQQLAKVVLEAALKACPVGRALIQLCLKNPLCLAANFLHQPLGLLHIHKAARHDLGTRE